MTIVYTMESLHLSRSVIENLNSFYSKNVSIQKHIQTGKRINKPIDDLGENGKLANLNLERLSNYRTKQNLQNSISFLQSQQGKLKVVTKVLTRMGELNTLANSPIANKSTKVIYDREFKELQEEIRDIGTSKWNGISLFSSQASKVLVGNAIDDPNLYQGNSGISPDSTNSMTRWGIYHGLADKIQAGDKLPSGFGENPPKNLLAFAISDESIGSYAPNGHAKFNRDIDNWIGLMGEKNIDGKIGLIRAEETRYGKDLLPTGEPVPKFAELHEVMPRDDTTAKEAQGLQFLKDTFLSMTDNGESLPDAFGIFVDNSGSLKFNEVDSPAQDMMSWVQNEYGGQVAISSENGGDWRNGIFLASDEEWIARSQEAVESMLADPDFNVLVEDGSLDQSESGVKGLIDPVYSIADFDQEELQMFLEKCTEAISVNAAEQERFQSEYDELALKDVGLERYFENAVGLDIPSAMAAYRLSRVQMDINANLMGAVRDMENVLYTDFLE